jgi:hypothetical protein
LQNFLPGLKILLRSNPNDAHFHYWNPKSRLFPAKLFSSSQNNGAKWDTERVEVRVESSAEYGTSTTIGALPVLDQTKTSSYVPECVEGAFLMFSMTRMREWYSRLLRRPFSTMPGTGGNGIQIIPELELVLKMADDFRKKCVI